MPHQRIYSRIVYQETPWRESGELIIDEANSRWTWYEGPVAECKKGREGIEATAEAQKQQAASDAATRKSQLDAMNPDLQALDVRPGHLSSAAESRLGADLSKIDTTYNNAGQVGLKTIAQRGLGGPSGASSSLTNSLLTSRAHDENAAHDSAQQQSHDDMLAAIGARTGLQKIYDPNAALDGASNSFARRAQMGSTLGDIGSGLTTVAGLATGGYNLGNAVNKGSQSNGCWIAEAIYGPTDFRTHIVRAWLNGPFMKTRIGRVVMAAYLKFGERVAGVVRRSAFLRFLFRPLFDRALSNAIAERQ